WQGYGHPVTPVPSPYFYSNRAYRCLNGRGPEYPLYNRWRPRRLCPFSTPLRSDASSPQASSANRISGTHRCRKRRFPSQISRSHYPDSLCILLHLKRAATSGTVRSEYPSEVFRDVSTSLPEGNCTQHRMLHRSTSQVRRHLSGHVPCTAQSFSCHMCACVSSGGTDGHHALSYP